MKRHQPLGDQALHLIRDTGIALRELDRQTLRQKVEDASQRPAIGTSDALGRPLRSSVSSCIDDKTGKLRTADTHDLVGMSMIQLLDGSPVHAKVRATDPAYRDKKEEASSKCDVLSEQ